MLLDRDLAELYNIETKQLKRAVRRNINRFPEDFMFELSKEELENWRYQFGTANREIMRLWVLPSESTSSAQKLTNMTLSPILSINNGHYCLPVMDNNVFLY